MVWASQNNNENKKALRVFFFFKESWRGFFFFFYCRRIVVGFQCVLHLLLLILFYFPQFEHLYGRPASLQVLMAMPHTEPAFCATAAAADVRLSAADAWATDVLQRCARVHYTPQKDLLRMFAPLSTPLTPATTSYCPSVAEKSASEPPVVDVDAEEDATASSTSPVMGSPDFGYVSPGGGSFQPYLPRVVRAAPTADMQAVRAALSSSVLRKAYRVQTPCVTMHTTKGERLLNCAASPKCMSGLRTLAGDAVTREDYLKAAMGDGPYVVAVPAPKSSPTAAATLPSSHSDAVGNVKGVRAAATTATVTTTTARSVVSDPTFPCLWRGVKNLTNTCYFSSVLQMVFSVARLRRVILDDGAAAGVSTQLEESGLKELFALMAFSREGCGADPKSFASYLSLDVKVQQDAQEFFTLLLDWLRCHCGPAVETAVTNTFSGTLLYDRHCGACGRSAKRAEPFLHLSLPVRSTLEDSLSEFSKPEEVDGFMCEGCGKTAVATSRQYMRTLPDVLIIHWNRFGFDVQTLQRHKVTTATSFPLRLDMARYVRQWHEQKRSCVSTHATGTTAGTESAKEEEVEENYCYELRGIVNHHGDTAVSGHYTYHGKVPLSSSSSPASAVAEGTNLTDTWLNFNDAEVTPLNRYQGQRGVSADAYLLVYHRVAPSSAAATAAKTRAATTAVKSESDANSATAVMSTSAAPTPAEFPLYLRQYVDQVNQRCLDERQAWLDQRAKAAAFFDLWAATAQAVFDGPSSPPSAWAATTSASAAFYALPTSWLQQLGRSFLPAYVDVTAFGGGAGSQLKRNRKDTSEGIAGAGSGAAASEGSAGAVDESMNLTSDEESAAAGANGTPVDGAVAVPAMGPRCHGDIHSLEELHQLVRRYSLLQALPSLQCSHGYLAPWGAYKLVTAAAFDKLSHFLHMCGAPLKAADQADAANTGIDSSSCAVDARTSCAFVDANMCPLCVAAMAAVVRDQAVASAEDEQAERCLTQAWQDAEERKKEEAEEGNAAGAGAGASSLTDVTQKDSCSALSTDRNDEESGEVLVSETVVEGWATFYVNQLAWSRVQQVEGYTGVVMMKEAHLNPPRVPSSCTYHNTRSTSCNDNSCSGATSPSSPASLTNMATLGSTTVSPMLASAEDGVNTIALNMDKRDLDLSSELLCPHGALRPGQHVLAVPASLRRYWIRRFAEVLTMAHRAGQLCTADPGWRVTEEDIGYLLLPYIPASTASTTCLECMRTSVQSITFRHHQRLRKMEERKKFPSLWLAGAMTSPAGVAQLLLATGAENEEQLLAAQHPNRLFFKHNAEREYREYAKKWTEAQQARIAVQEAEVTRLQTTVAKKKERDAAWNARVTSRRGGRNAGRGSGSPTRNAEADAAAAASPPDPETLEGRLYNAEATLAKLRAQPVPDFSVSYGCVPTWWVARWYAAMQDDGPHANIGSSDNNIRSNSADSLDGAAAAKYKDDVAQRGNDADTAGLPPITYREFLCEHGGCLLDVPWLNPSDVFWQGVRGKRAEVLWNGARVERATTHNAAANGAGASASGPGREEYRSQCWLPPLVILPMEEYLALLAQYGRPDVLERFVHNNNNNSDASAAEAAAAPAVTDVNAEDTNAAPSTAHQSQATAENTKDSAAAEPSTHSQLSPVPEAVIQLVTHNGVRQLQPAACAACRARLLANFEVSCESFVNGSLKLNFHIKKSRKGFYDASSVLTSAAVQQSRFTPKSSAATQGSHPGAAIPVSDNDDSNRDTDATSPDGIHYYTTLAQLRLYISAHLRDKHGYLVQPADLQIMRGKNKPLKLRSPPPPPPPQQQQQGQQADSATLEQASLQDLGIRDGDTLSVQSVDVIAQTCATAAGADEEWEAIPPELLLQAGSGGGAGALAGATAACEHTAAFRETRLQGSRAAAASSAAVPAAADGGGAGMATARDLTGATVAAGSASGEEHGVACPVCTFLNAPGMVICEMCEAPLPTR